MFLIFINTSAFRKDIQNKMMFKLHIFYFSYGLITLEKLPKERISKEKVNNEGKKIVLSTTYN